MTIVIIGTRRDNSPCIETLLRIYQHFAPSDNPRSLAHIRPMRRYECAPLDAETARLAAIELQKIIDNRPPVAASKKPAKWHDSGIKPFRRFPIPKSTRN